MIIKREYCAKKRNRGMKIVQGEYEKSIDYQKFSDEELVQRTRAQDTQAMTFLLNKYKGLVRKRARAMFLIGGETEDLIQEGMIGLFKAIRDFDVTKEVSFFTFADICIARQIYTAVQASNRKKHTPLNSYISLSKDEDDEKGLPAIEEILKDSNGQNPEDLVIGREILKDKMEYMKKGLSPFEEQVLELFLEGEDYIEIGDTLHKEAKSIDNALQRIKQKIRTSMRNMGDL